MKEKYLPIGTIVRLANNNKKIMITGYYSIEYNDLTVKIFDYSGTVYPEGFLAKNNFISFNHKDIIGVDFEGYVEDSFKVLNKQLNSQFSNETLDDNDNLNFTFDKNGIVNYEYGSDDHNKVLTSDNLETRENPFEIKGSKIESNNAPTVKPKYKFNSSAVEDNTEAKKDIEDINNNFNFAFDENGRVIEETEIKTNSEDKPGTNNVDFEFDANGHVVGETSNDDDSSAEAPKANYKFDANGIVTAE